MLEMYCWRFSAKCSWQGHHVVLIQPDTQCGCEIAASEKCLASSQEHLHQQLFGEAGGSRDRVPITQAYGDFRQLRYGTEVTAVSIKIALDVL